MRSEQFSKVLLIAFSAFFITLGCFSVLIYDRVHLLEENQKRQIKKLELLALLDDTGVKVLELNKIYSEASSSGSLRKEEMKVLRQLRASVSRLGPYEDNGNYQATAQLKNNLSELQALNDGGEEIGNGRIWMQRKRLAAQLGESVSILKKSVYFEEVPAKFIFTSTFLYISLTIVATVVIFLTATFIILLKSIIKRKEAEECCRKNEQKYESLFQGSPVMFLILDPYTHEILSVNNNTASFLGLSTGQIIGRTAPELGIFSSKNDLEQLLIIATERTPAVDYVTSVVTQNGAKRIVSCNLDLVVFEGQTTLFIAFFDVTVQKEAELAIKESQDVFATLFFKSPSILALTDIETGKILEVNEKHEEFFGYGRDEVIGKTPLELGLFADTGLGEQIFEEFRDQDYHHKKIDLLLVTRSEETKPVSYSAGTICLKGRRQKLVSIQDLTEIKKTEDILKKSEQIYYSLFYKSPVILCISEPDTGIFIDVNENFCSHFGYEKDDIIGKSSKEASIWPDYRVRGEMLTELKRGEPMVNREMYLMNKEGDLLCLYGHADLVNINGRTLMICAFIDATEEKRARMEILKLNEVLEERVVERTKEIRDYKYALDESAIIAITDSDGLVQHVNPNFSILSGYKKTDIYGMKVTLLSKNQNTEQQELIAKCIRTGTVWKGELEQQTKTGEVYWTYTHIIPFLDRNSDPYQYLFIGWDITQKKLAELENEQVTHELIQRNKNLEQYGYIVSHNLRAPLSNILGIVQLLQSPDLSVNEREVLSDDLLKCGTKLDEVIKDLNTALFASRNIAEAKEEIKLDDLLASVQSTFVRAIRREGAIIDSDFSSLDALYSIRSYLTSIFYNLLSNSFKYRNPDLPPIVKIRSFEMDNKAIIQYTDNGLGIDLRKHGDKVFGLYKRFHSHKQGRGIGLFMVKTQVETLGGKISIESEILEGTTFVIELPLQDT